MSISIRATPEIPFFGHELAMEFGWRARWCLLLVVAVLVIERGAARPGDQLGGSTHSPAAQQPAGDGRPRRQHQHQGQPQHDHDHDQDHDHQHKHRQAQRTSHARRHRRPQDEHQTDAASKPLHPPLPLPHGLSRSDGGGAHDLLDCEPQPGDRLLARSVVRAEFQPLAFAQASWFFPQSGADDRTLHCVRVLDQRRDGYGGYPSIARGGVGHHFVELAFKSDFSRGFHFVVEVYGQ